MEPAVELAEGFEVHERFRSNLVNSEEGIRRFATTAATFLPDGHVVELGDTFAQSDLAAADPRRGGTAVGW